MRTGRNSASLPVCRIHLQEILRMYWKASILSAEPSPRRTGRCRRRTPKWRSHKTASWGSLECSVWAMCHNLRNYFTVKYKTKRSYKHHVGTCVLVHCSCLSGMKEITFKNIFLPSFLLFPLYLELLYKFRQKVL